MPRSDMKPAVEMTAKFMESLGADERVKFIEQLRKDTKFCWNCGFDFRDKERVCYCENNT